MTKSKGIGWKSDDSVRTEVGPTTVRGKIISSPIPFPEDDEFPFRSHGPTISISHQPQDVEKQLQLEALAPTEPRSISKEEENDTFADRSSMESFDPRPPQPPYSPPPPPPITQPIHARIASTTAAPSNAGVDRPKRKKSSLRAVFSKLFGKKQKESPPLNTHEGDSEARVGLHRSDPTPLRNMLKSDNNPSQKRSVSLPINELDRALRSHSTTAEDFRFPLTPNLNRGSMAHADGKTSEDQEKPRRATLSGVWSPGRIPGYADWTGLSPRPASSHAKGSKAATDDASEGAVGIALTSGSHHNRRSRSAGELRSLVTTGFNMRDTGRHWGEGERPAKLPLTPVIIESYPPAGLPSTPSTFQGKIPVDYPISPSIKDGTEEPDLLTEGDTSRNEETELSQLFNFGPGAEVADKAIAQSTTLDERMKRLEERMSEIEKVVFQPGNHTQVNQPIGEERSRTSRRSERSPASTRPRTSNSEISIPKQPKFREMLEPRVSEGLTSQASAKQFSYDSRRPSVVSTNTSYQPSFDAEPLPQSLTPADHKLPTTHQNNARPLSNTTTIRGLPGTPPTFPINNKPTEENYASLLNMILAEREARQELEALVLKLQQRLHTLAWTSGPGSNLAKPLGESRVTEQFLDLEHDDNSIDDGQYTNEEFRTPNEETGLFGDEIFGETAHMKTGSKTAPRVVSLSQMTLGRNAQPGLGF